VDRCFAGNARSQPVEQPADVEPDPDEGSFLFSCQLSTDDLMSMLLYLLHCVLSLAAQCIVIGPVCGFMCLWVCLWVC